MSVRFLNNNASNNTDVTAKTSFNSNLPLVTRSSTPWVRNPSWPACEANAGDNRVRGLYAVWPEGANFIAMIVSNAHTVDYGDGTITNYGAGVQANYEYSYSAAALVGTEAPVTFTDAGDLVTRTGHGYTNGMQVRFFNITTTTGIVNGQFYFVINATANTFQVSATSGGAALTLTNDGTGQLLPYRIATVTITPQASNDLTSVNLSVRYTNASFYYVLPQGYATGWLDLAFAAPALTALSFPSSTLTVSQRFIERVRLNQLGAIGTFASQFSGLTELQNVEIASTITTVTSTSNMFSSCHSLQTAPLFNTDSVTNMSGMFQQCFNLQEVPLYNTASVTNMSSMFYQCYSLQTVPLFNTAAVTDMNFMLASTVSFQTVPLFNTANVQNMSGMFSASWSLLTVPLFNTVSVTNMSSMFNATYSLQTVPLFNTANVTNMGYMFSFSQALREVPLFNTASVTNMGNMFQRCYNLQKVPLFNTAAVTSMTTMFSDCFNLRTVPLFNTALVTDMSSMFSSCYNLETVPLFNVASNLNFTSMFNNCYSLKEVPLFNIRTSGSVSMTAMFSNCISLSAVPLFNTIAVTSMQQMFTSCSALQTVPLFNTANVATMLAMFSNSQSLQTVPLFNTAAVTSMAQMFQNCVALETVPPFNMSANTSTNNMFYQCRSLLTVPAFTTSSALTNTGFMFSECTKLQTVPVFNTANVTDAQQMFQNCTNLVAVPAFSFINVTSVTGFSSTYSSAFSIARIEATNMGQTFTIINSKLSRTALEEVFNNVRGTFVGSTLNAYSNYGVDQPYFYNVPCVALQKTFSMASTAGLAVGMFATGAFSGSVTAAGATANVTTDTFTQTNHGLFNGLRFSPQNIGVVTGITVYAMYYVINATANTFQISLTPGGAAVNLTGSNGSITYRFPNKIVSIVPNTSITLDAPATANGTRSWTFRFLDSGSPLIRGWSVSL